TPRATPEPSTLSLHDALPICIDSQRRVALCDPRRSRCRRESDVFTRPIKRLEGKLDRERDLQGRRVDELQSIRRVDLGTELRIRSEEHTSELQSRGHLVCRLL